MYVTDMNKNAALIVYIPVPRVSALPFFPNSEVMIKVSKRRNPP